MRTTRLPYEPWMRSSGSKPSSDARSRRLSRSARLSRHAWRRCVSGSMEKMAPQHCLRRQIGSMACWVRLPP